MNSEAISSITRDLLALGVRPGGVLLVHASLRSLGYLPERAGQVIQGLRDAIGPRGTLLLPALSYESVGSRCPVFDVRSTPTCVGALPEYFRTQVPGVVRSAHPTHSVCGIGPRVEELFHEHVLSTTPCGAQSPFARLPQMGGQILFLGCGLRPNTSMHAVEEHIVPPYLYSHEVDYRILLADGSETTMRVLGHNFRGWEQRYDRIETVMDHGLRRGRVLEADCYLLEAAEMWAAALAALRQDPLYFVDKTEE